MQALRAVCSVAFVLPLALQACGDPVPIDTSAVDDLVALDEELDELSCDCGVGFSSRGTAFEQVQACRAWTRLGTPEREVFNRCVAEFYATHQEECAADWDSRRRVNRYLIECYETRGCSCEFERIPLELVELEECDPVLARELASECGEFIGESE